MKLLHVLVSVAAISGLGACAELQGTSYLNGDHWYGRADPHLERVAVLAIDGVSPLRGNPVQIDPGDHMLTLAARPVAGFHDAPTLETKFHVEPCKTYYIVAHRESPLTQKFDLVTQEVEPLAGCALPK